MHLHIPGRFATGLDRAFFSFLVAPYSLFDCVHAGTAIQQRKTVCNTKQRLVCADPGGAQVCSSWLVHGSCALSQEEQDSPGHGRSGADPKETAAVHKWQCASHSLGFCLNSRECHAVLLDVAFCWQLYAPQLR